MVIYVLFINKLERVASAITAVNRDQQAVNDEIK